MIAQAVSAATVLELRDVVKSFGITRGSFFRRRIGRIQAVAGVSLDVRQGETLGLVGESGCGKTTLGRLMVALERPDSGTIRFLGDDRLVAEPLVVQRIGTGAERAHRTAALLEEVGLSRRAAQRYPHEFSGGQRQRIGLARALALNPTIVVADEPVSALDVSVRAQVLNLMSRLQQTHRLTYVFISHDLSVVRYLADRIAVMYLGKIVEIGDSQTVFELAGHPYTAELLKAVPVPIPSVERAKVGHATLGEVPSAVDPPSGCRFRTRCPLAQPVCAEIEPPLRRMRTGQLAACHFPLQAPD